MLFIFSILWGTFVWHSALIFRAKPCTYAGLLAIIRHAGSSFFENLMGLIVLSKRKEKLRNERPCCCEA